MAEEKSKVTYTDTSALGSEEFHKRFDEAIETVRDWLGRRHPNHIGGEEAYSREGEFEVRCPFDKRMVIGRFQRGTREDAGKAIEAAKAVFWEWSHTDHKERCKLFRRAADIAERERFRLAALMCFEAGKNRSEAMGDVAEAIELMRYYASEMERNEGYRRVMGRIGNETGYSVLKPYGVWAVVSPFNFPLALVVNMSTGVLITGNTEVFKPASDTPFTGLKFYEVMEEAGLPQGVLNYLAGRGAAIGDELVENLDVSGIIFTGSKQVGVSLYKSFIQVAPRPFIAELGGKNPVIVTAKADLEKASRGIVKAAFGYDGQKCSAASRVFVDRRVKDGLMELLIEKTSRLRIGNPLERETDMGSVINETAYKNYNRYVETARQDGKILIGGKLLEEGELKQGFYVEPTIVEGLPMDHLLLREELFLPILTVTEVESLDEALELANSVEYGLTSGIFSEDRDEVEEFFDKIEAGVAYANRAASATTGAWPGVQPFGGWKYSGTSGKCALGQYYLPQFMREQSQTIVEV